jgi:hypothetical protein
MEQCPHLLESELNGVMICEGCGIITDDCLADKTTFKYKSETKDSRGAGYELNLSVYPIPGDIKMLMVDVYKRIGHLFDKKYDRNFFQFGQISIIILKLIHYLEYEYLFKSMVSKIKADEMFKTVKGLLLSYEPNNKKIKTKVPRFPGVCNKIDISGPTNHPKFPDKALYIEIGPPKPVKKSYQPRLNHRNSIYKSKMLIDKKLKKQSVPKPKPKGYKAKPKPKSCCSACSAGKKCTGK